MPGQLNFRFIFGYLKNKLGIIWELKINRLSESSNEFSNHVVVFLTADFLDLLTKVNITDLEPIQNNRHQNLKTHNEEETPLFAKGIEKKALNGIWK